MFSEQYYYSIGIIICWTTKKYGNWKNNRTKTGVFLRVTRDQWQDKGVKFPEKSLQR